MPCARATSRPRRRAWDFEFVGPNYSVSEYHGEGAGIAIRKGEEDLRFSFQRGDRQDPRGDGTYLAIAAKYLDFDVYGPEAQPRGATPAVPDPGPIVCVLDFQGYGPWVFWAGTKITLPGRPVGGARRPGARAARGVGAARR